MIQRAQKNLQHYNTKAELIVGDALKSDIKTTVVTDLPYGKNSKASDLKELYTQFLIHVTCKKMIVGFPSLVDYQTLILRSGWFIKESFAWQLNRSLTKTICVLTRD